MYNKNNPYSFNKYFDVLKLLHKRRRGINEIAKHLGQSQRTAYRFIERLIALDFPIDVDFNKKYFVNKDYCPFCERTKK